MRSYFNYKVVIDLKLYIALPLAAYTQDVDYLYVHSTASTRFVSSSTSHRSDRSDSQI